MGWNYSLAQLGWYNDETKAISLTDPKLKVVSDGSSEHQRDRRQFVVDNQEQVLRYAQLGHEYTEGSPRI